jgi:hypothetical protein
LTCLNRTLIQTQKPLRKIPEALALAHEAAAVQGFKVVPLS